MKIGDKVICVDPQEHNDLYFGKVYIIESLDENNTRLCKVIGLNTMFFRHRFKNTKPTFKGNIK